MLDLSQTGLTALKNIVATASGAGIALFENLQRSDAALAKQLNAAQPSRETNTPSSRVPPQPQIEFDDLMQLDDADLGCVLQKTTGRVLLLALAGASKTFIEKIYRQLPRADAQALRQQIEQQGPIRLRDVEEAQRRIGLVAAQLAESGEINLPAPRRFTVAA